LKVLTKLAALAAAPLLLIAVGRKVRPLPFPPLPANLGGTHDLSAVPSIPLPAGLPAPVERFYKTLYGNRVPVVTTAVLSGRSLIRPAGPLMFPARFRLTHIAGQAYRHYIEVTFFGIPVIKANEYYRDGHGRMDITVIGTDEGPKYDQAANLALWAEASYFPSLFITDPRARWEPVDETTAVLVVPFGSEEERITVRFDPQTHLITWLESMRYKASTSNTRVLWLNHLLSSEVRNKQQYPPVGEVIWMDDGKPWFALNVEDVVYNADLSEYVRATGP
jgi:hypothetical protein